MGVDEIYLGKKMKFLTVVRNLESTEPVWFWQDRKQETLDEFFQTQLTAWQRNESTQPMWTCGSRTPTAFSNGLPTVGLSTTNSTFCSTPTGPSMKSGGGVLSQGWTDAGFGERQGWLLLSLWVNLDHQKRQQLNELFALNRRVMKADLLKESLERLWNYRKFLRRTYYSGDS